jgi:hypothetical protein
MKALHRRVGLDTVAGLRAIAGHVRSTKNAVTDAAFVAEIAPDLRKLEREITAQWHVLEAEMLAAARHDATTIGHDATPLQRAVPVDHTAAEVLHYV